MTIETLTTETDLEVLPPARPVQAEAVAQLMAHAQAMQTAKQLADAMCDTDLVPATYRGKPGNGAAAILYGAELGLTPIQSLQQIFVVHGTPAIYARTAVALVKRHGYQVRTIEESDESVTVSATDPRTGHVEVSTWDITRAERAGFTSNKKYQTEPRAMLWAKAAMEVCRRIAPDVLLGIAYASEELEIEPVQQVRSERPERARGVAALAQRVTPTPEAQAAPAPPAETSTAMAPATRKKWLNAMFAALGEADCTDRDDQLAVIAALAGRPDSPPEHRDSISDDELRTVVNALNAARKDSQLGAVVTEILNTAALREAAAHDNATTIDGTN